MQKLSDRTIEERLDKLEGWEYIDGAIQTTFEFENFKEAFSVMTRMAFEFEKYDHHPDWTNIYDTLIVRLSTHSAKGITEKDFELAHVIERIIGEE